MRVFRHFSQLELSDCGPACLKMILRYYGKDCDLLYLRDLCTVTRTGVSMGDIVNAGRALHFNCMAVQTTPEALMEKATLPCILHWRQDHFVVLYRISSRYFYIADPGYGKIRLPRHKFSHLWKGTSDKGVALMLAPRETFEGLLLPYTSGWAGKKKGLFFLVQHLKIHRGKLLLLALFLTISTSLSYLFPNTMQRLVDGGINRSNYQVVWGVLLFQAGILMGQLIFDWLRGFVSVHFSMQVSLQVITHFLQKLIRLPIRFFDNRLNTDILQRIEDHQRIESFLTQQIIQAVFSCLLIITLSIRLLQYGWWIFICFIVLSLAAIAWIFLFNARRRNLDYYNFRLSSENRNALIELVTGMKEVKINNAQENKIGSWQEIKKQIYGLKVRSLYVNLYQVVGVHAITQIKNIGINGICAIGVIQGNLTIGEMLSIGYITGMLSGPLTNITDFIQATVEAKTAFDRIDEIHRKEDENTAGKVAPPEDWDHIYLENAAFKYDGSMHPFVLEDITLQIPRGKITAIVGSSGSGKSTLLKLLLSFYYPQKGQLRVGQQEMKNIDPDAWREQCGVVLQDGYIFSGTIAENIALTDSEPDSDLLWFAARTACIDAFIRELPMQFDTKIGNAGADLSGGQKQRLLIARAIYRNPRILFLDEATSSLDARNEKDILTNLSTFLQGKTVIVVAHRLSTVKHADQIIVLEKGKVIECGTHHQLVTQRQKYYELIRNQLELGT
ncbi:peptidase domain-containing ABC transporter [Chitinophaga pendula]|uniref:peptidase domain-containing ABC transporter n=1 Tax=Chitinophaga TaxID=79328 RepID=UPI000BB06376|nr:MULTISPECIES: peptidase domain-containing ABC transporter [Chitinophaga]ASZ11357.1 ABC transporter ATP-binding protein [Chitinophaga sp. MD30]UCJ05641.1 peptidase domain-containing ABC transporter [Chitinophaga pendula]